MPSNTLDLPKVIGGICEYCGKKAAACKHNEAFRKAGLLTDSATSEFTARLRDTHVEGLPRIKSDMCEFCGVYFLSEKCIHLKARRKAVFGDETAVDDTVVVTEDTEAMVAKAKANRERREAAARGSRPVGRKHLAKELGGDGEPREEETINPDIDGD